MAPSSAYASAPKKVSTPVRLHTMSISPADGRLRATALGTRKIAEPITVPIRIAVASTRPSLRGSSAFDMSGKASARGEVRASARDYGFGAGGTVGAGGVVPGTVNPGTGVGFGGGLGIQNSGSTAANSFET